MGVDYHVYVGPYIEVRNPPKSSFLEYYGCPNNKCKDFNKHINAKFCPQCGKQIELLTVPTQKPMEFDCYEEFDDRLSEVRMDDRVKGKEDCEFYLPNQGKTGKHFSAYDRQILSYDAAIIALENESIETKFAKDIKRLREVFGKDAVTIQWGIIAYAS